MNPAGAGPLKSPFELSEELGDRRGTFGELGSGSLGRLARGVQGQRDGCQIRWPLQLGLAAYGHQRNRAYRFCHDKTLRRDRQSAVKEHHNGPFPLRIPWAALGIYPPHLPFAFLSMLHDCFSNLPVQSTTLVTRPAHLSGQVTRMTW
jgi:hypothetical protein